METFKVTDVDAIGRNMFVGFYDACIGYSGVHLSAI